MLHLPTAHPRQPLQLGPQFLVVGVLAEIEYVVGVACDVVGQELEMKCLGVVDVVESWDDFGDAELADDGVLEFVVVFGEGLE